MRSAKRIWGYIQYLLLGRYRGVVVEDIPDVLKRKVLYLASDEGVDWLAVFLCPCGCSEKIHLNLLAESRPCWRVSMGDSKIPSVTPSVWRSTGCCSHFFLRKGKIVWVK